MFQPYKGHTLEHVWIHFNKRRLRTQEIHFRRHNIASVHSLNIKWRLLGSRRSDMQSASECALKQGMRAAPRSLPANEPAGHDIHCQRHKSGNEVCHPTHKSTDRQKSRACTSCTCANRCFKSRRLSWKGRKSRLKWLCGHLAMPSSIRR